MEFWGVEVKSGETLKVESGEGFIVHLSQACLGEAKKDKGNESVCLFVSVDDQKLVLGTLSHEKFPQIPFDLVFEKGFELSHNLKNGSVFFSGYKFDSDSEEDLPVPVDNGKQEAKPSKPEKDNAAKPDSKQKVKIVEPNKDLKPGPEDDDSDEEDDSSADGESSDDQEMMANEEDESSEDEDDESDDDSDDGDVKTTKKAEAGKKRSAEAALKTPVPDKKAKFATPQKTDLKKVGGHTATPYPSKQVAKTSAANSQKKEQTQKSFACSSCNRSFGSDNALQSHTKAKHGAA
ncbi:unnamed protein product [Dovyalis caffra]|uniref:C2H2-type domain-containing protein n=1 Tax=Dovyalis caffra TaxID=77055 RepID=A0AAV1S151_9ROSI|nr:unnamed protein product [Dovyalis caffra]